MATTITEIYDKKNFFDIDQPKTRLLLEEADIREIVSKRDDFDRTILMELNPPATLKQMLQYIVYENTLLSRISRVEKQKKTEFCLSVTIVEKMRMLYVLATDHYPREGRLWDEYIVFCRKNITDNDKVHGIVTDMWQRNANLSEYWLKAIKWKSQHYTGADRHESLRRLTVDAHQKHPRNVALFHEMVSATLSGDDDVELRVARAVEYYKGRDKGKTQEFEFHQTLLDIAGKHEFAGELEQCILDELQVTYVRQSEYWHMLAMRELHGKRTYNYHPNEPPRTFEKRIWCCFHLYDTAIGLLPTIEICEHYLDTMYEVYKNKEAPMELRSRMVAHSFKRVHAMRMMSVRHYILFVDVMKRCKSKADVIGVFLREATDVHRRSLPIWKMYMQHCIRMDDYSKVAYVFEQTQRRIPNENSSIWTMYVHYLQLYPTKNRELIKCYEEAIRKKGAEFDEIKMDYLTMRVMGYEGIRSMRKVFQKICSKDALTINVFCHAYQFESLQCVPDMKNWRHLNKLAIDKLGKKEERVWQVVVDFEREHGTQAELSALYVRACTIVPAVLLPKVEVHFKLPANNDD